MKRLLQKTVPLVLIVMLLISVIDLSAYAAECTVLDGYIKISDTSGNVSANGTTVTAKAAGSKSSTVTNTLTITNNTDSAAAIYFAWSATGDALTGSGAIVVDGTSYSQSGKTAKTGTFSKNMEAGSSITIELTSTSGKYAANTVMLTLSGFTYEPVASTYAVTVNHTTGGSVTLDGATVTSGTVYDVSPTSGASLAATVNSGYAFLGWIDGDSKLLSTSTSYTVTPAADMNVQAVFVNKTSDTAWFRAGDYLTTDLNTAATKSTTVILMNNGTLAAGSYTIPSGVTLLIPFDDSNTIFTTDHQTGSLIKSNPGLVESGTTAATGPYRTLTMASGANITVNGNVCLPAKLNAPGGGRTNAGAPTGAVPYIAMEGTSNITLNSGSYLYCYGFITGTGTVTVNSGATVYECFQIRDYRGGSGSSGISNSVFPSSQYYIQNVEVPTTYKSGSSLKCVSAVTVSVTGIVYMSDISIIGTSDSLFTNSGPVTKTYDGNTDRLVIDIAGNASLGNVVLNFGSLGVSIDSANYVLGLNNNMTVNILSGKTTANQRIALQPGAVINIAESAELELGSNMYVYDADEWGDYIYCEQMTTALGGIEHPSSASMQDANNWAAVQVAFAPGKAYTRTLTDLVDAKINVNGTLTATSANLYTTASGAEIVSSEGRGQVVLTAGTETVTYQADMNSSADLAYYSIDVKSAWLKNADGSYLQSGTNTYTYTDGKWICKTHTGVDTDHTCDVCGYVTICVDADGDYNCDVCTKSMCEHTELNLVEAKDGYCGEQGNTAYYTCVCGKFFNEANEEIEKDSWLTASKGHTLTAHEAKAATCTEAGNSAYWQCTLCKKYFSDAAGETEIAENSWVKEKADHSYDNDCDTECNNGCGTTREASHSYETTVTAPTCTTGGSTTHTCSNCGDTYTDGETAAAGHTKQTVTGKAATCEETGLTDGAKCGTCGDTITEQEVVPALGHKWSDATYNAPKTCSVCGKTSGDPLAQPVEVVAPENVESTKEDSSITDEEAKAVIDAFVKSANSIAQTESGIDAEDNREIVEQAKNEIPAESYNTTLQITLTGVTVAKDNSNTVAKRVVYDVTPYLHAIDKDGNIIKEIELNDFVSELTFRLPMDMNTTAKYAEVWHENESMGLHEIQTDDNGYKYVEVKAKTFSQFSAEAHDHSYGTEWQFDENNHWLECSCGAMDSEAAHGYTSEVTTAAGCETTGVRTYTCECGRSYTETIEATGHLNTTTINAKAATCGVAGHTGDTYCNDCQKIIATGETISATGEHSYGEGEVTKEATTTETGVMTYTCTVCSATKTEEIAKLAGTTVNIDVITNSLSTGPQITLLTGTTAGDGWEYEGNVIAGSTVDFKVAFDKACVVIVATTDSEGNVTYTRQTATATEDENTYQFSVAVVENMEIVVRVKGDATGDGKVNASDVLRMKQIANNVGAGATEMQKIACNLVGTDIVINASDVLRIKQVANGVGNALTW